MHDPLFWLAAVAAAVLVGMGKGGLPVVGMLGVPVLSLAISPVTARPSCVNSSAIGAVLPRLVYYLMHRDFVRTPVIGRFTLMMGTLISSPRSTHSLAVRVAKMSFSCWRSATLPTAWSANLAPGLASKSSG